MFCFADDVLYMSKNKSKKQILIQIILLIFSTIIFGITLISLQKFGYKIYLYPTFNGVINDPNSIANNFIFTPYGLFTYGASFYLACVSFAWAKRDKTALRELWNVFALLICLAGFVISIIDAFVWHLMEARAQRLSHTLFIVARFMTMGCSIIFPMKLIFVAMDYWEKRREAYLWLRLLKFYEDYRDDPKHYYVLTDQKFLNIDKNYTVDEHLDNIQPRRFSSYNSALSHAETLINDYITENIREDCHIFEQTIYKQLQNENYSGPLPVVLGKYTVTFFPVEEAYRQITEYFDSSSSQRSYFPEYGLLIMRNFEQRTLSFVWLDTDKSYQSLKLRTVIPNPELEGYVLDHLQEMILDVQKVSIFGPWIIELIEDALIGKGYREGQDWDFVKGTGPETPSTILDL